MISFMALANATKIIFLFAFVHKSCQKPKKISRNAYTCCLYLYNWFELLSLSV